MMRVRVIDGLEIEKRVGYDAGLACPMPERCVSVVNRYVDKSPCLHGLNTHDVPGSSWCVTGLQSRPYKRYAKGYS